MLQIFKDTIILTLYLLAGMAAALLIGYVTGSIEFI